jgi:Txe/YoeB family toxin of Txe-Axe toxin-antitoxin module
MNKQIRASAKIHSGDGGYSVGTQEEYIEFVKNRNRSMNERILELIEECTDRHFSECIGGFETFDKEKFAELIVKECADVSNQAEKQCQHPGTMIKQHFGVE